jgi:hypothetical protein
MNKKSIKEEIKKEIYNMLNEDVNYTFNFKGKKFKVRFDVNHNETKKGVKIQFTPFENLASNPQNAKVVMNDLQVLLNQKLATIGLSVDFDPDVPYANTIGFTLKLGSLSTMIINALQGKTPQNSAANSGIADVQPEGGEAAAPQKPDLSLKEIKVTPKFNFNKIAEKIALSIFKETNEEPDENETWHINKDDDDFNIHLFKYLEGLKKKDEDGDLRVQVNEDWTAALYAGDKGEIVVEFL